MSGRTPWSREGGSRSTSSSSSESSSSSGPVQEQGGGSEVTGVGSLQPPDSDSTSSSEEEEEEEEGGQGREGHELRQRVLGNKWTGPSPQLTEVEVSSSGPHTGLSGGRLSSSDEEESDGGGGIASKRKRTHIGSNSPPIPRKKMAGAQNEDNGQDQEDGGEPSSSSRKRKRRALPPLTSKIPRISGYSEQTLSSRKRKSSTSPPLMSKIQRTSPPPMSSTSPPPMSKIRVPGYSDHALSSKKRKRSASPPLMSKIQRTSPPPMSSTSPPPTGKIPQVSGHSDQALSSRKRKRSASPPLMSKIQRTSPPPMSKIPHISGYSEQALRMMESMGYKPGQGLGREGTGITAPITQSSQLGRRGIGYSVGELERAEVKWEEEEVIIHQKVEWLPSSKQQVPNEIELGTWMMKGKRKATIADEKYFFDHNVLKSILENKTMFDSLSTKEFLNSRQRSNPYETIKGAIFQNRAAMKMANMDAVTGFMFTDPKKENGASLGPFDVLYFADICAGPGGFSEYVLWRKKWHAKGFGFTLKDPDSGSDFKLDDFLASPCETFDPHYGVDGYNGDGDITRPDNQSEFKNYVMENTEGKGVHFAMADGGFSVEGQENIQELLLKQLVLCQYATCLSILRPGGCCVVKVFDMFTLFSIGLFYLLYRCFDRIALFKPVTSRPANSERYVICQGLLPGTAGIADYMYSINVALCELSGSDKDILEVVPLSLMEQDETFSAYITDFNNSFGLNQIIHLQKLQYFVKNSTLWDTRQADIRRRCLRLWKIPDQPRTSQSPLDKADHIFKEYWQRLYRSKEEADSKMAADIRCLRSNQFTTVTREGLDFLRCIHSWKWCWASGKRMMVVGLGRNNVHGWEMREDRPNFSPRRDLPNLELPRGTVIEIEHANELEGSGQKRSGVVYVLDVLAVYDEFLGDKPLKERQLYAEKLVKVLSKPCRGLVLRTKTHSRVADLCTSFPKLELKLCKGQSWPVPTVPVNNSAKFLAPVGMIFFKTIKDPWQLHIGSRGFYYFNAVNKKSTYECPPGSVASFLDVLKTRHLWMWDRKVFAGLCSGEEGEGEEVGEGSGEEKGLLTRRTLCSTLNHFRTQP